MVEANQPLVDPANEELWRQILGGYDPGFRKMRGFFGRIPSSPRCKQCNAPFTGIGGGLMRVIGKVPWEKNPHFCRQCYTWLAGQFGGAEIEVSLLFADVRGSTSLAERIGAVQFAELLNRFYKVAVSIVIDRDGLVDKFVGDEVVAIFAPGWAGPNHAAQAIAAADALLAATGHGPGKEPWLPIGAGVHTGVAYVGTVGAAGVVTDFTALGDPVNAAVRLASAAPAGQILVSAESAAAAGLDTTGLSASQQELRGRAEPLSVFELRAGTVASLLPRA